MRKLFAFFNISLDGYQAQPGGELSAFHNGLEAVASGEGAAVDTLLWGRRSYELMKSWATPQTLEARPALAEFLNSRAKWVASETAFDPEWAGVTVLSGDLLAQIRERKAGPGQTISVLGSSMVCMSLLGAGLIDEVQVLVDPVLFGAGEILFTGLPAPLPLRRTATRAFENGKMLLTYAPG